jgi:hypothetical protein
MGAVPRDTSSDRLRRLLAAEPHRSEVAAASPELRSVLWIGGGCFAGKTSVAERLSARYGLTHYRQDTLEYVQRTRTASRGIA